MYIPRNNPRQVGNKKEHSRNIHSFPGKEIHGPAVANRTASEGDRHAGHPIRTPGGEGPAPCPRPAAWTSAGSANGTPRPCITEQPQWGGADLRTMISTAPGALLRAIRRFRTEERSVGEEGGSRVCSRRSH